MSTITLPKTCFLREEGNSPAGCAAEIEAFQTVEVSGKLQKGFECKVEMTEAAYQALCTGTPRAEGPAPAGPAETGQRGLGWALMQTARVILYALIAARLGIGLAAGRGCQAAIDAERYLESLHS